MTIAALLARSSTQYRAGRRPLPAPPSAWRNAEQEQGPNGACDRVRGTGPAAPLPALPALNDVPHCPAAGALSRARLADVAAHIHFENRP